MVIEKACPEIFERLYRYIDRAYREAAYHAFKADDIKTDDGLHYVAYKYIDDMVDSIFENIAYGGTLKPVIRNIERAFKISKVSASDLTTG